MATYKSEAGAILQPGNQINRLSSFNTEGVYGWPGIEAYELIGYAKVENLAADKASYKSFDLIIPSPDRRPDDRVRDNRTSMVVQASAARPAYVYGASIAIGQDIPAGGEPAFPASPVTADLGGTTGEFILFGPDNAGSLLVCVLLRPTVWLLLAPLLLQLQALLGLKVLAILPSVTFLSGPPLPLAVLWLLMLQILCSTK